MSHTSSLVDSSKFLISRQAHSSTSLQSLLQQNSSYSLYSPGTTYSYCNFDVAVIGAICEKITGRHFYELAEQYLFDKLDIDASYIAYRMTDAEKLAALYGYGGYSIEKQLNESFCDELGQTHHLVQGNLTISAKDYAEILCVLINDGVANNGIKILTNDSVDEMLACHYEDNGEQIGYGLWLTDAVIDGERLAVHTGSNFGMFSSFVFSPQSGDGIVILTSGADGAKDYTADMTCICHEMTEMLFDYYIK